MALRCPFSITALRDVQSDLVITPFDLSCLMEHVERRKIKVLDILDEFDKKEVFDDFLRMQHNQR
jgi:hypothetical protein